MQYTHSTTRCPTPPPFPHLSPLWTGTGSLPLSIIPPHLVLHQSRFSIDGATRYWSLPVKVPFVITTGLKREEGASCRSCCSSSLSLRSFSFSLGWATVSPRWRRSRAASQDGGCPARCNTEGRPEGTGYGAGLNLGKRGPQLLSV